MKNLIILILMIVLTSCATTKTKETVWVKTYSQPQLHHADCVISGQRYSEANLLLLGEGVDKYQVRAGDGKTLGLPIDSCILTQVEKASAFSEDEPKQKWVKCVMEGMSLVTDSLIYLDDERHFYRLKRKDGQVWMLPRVHCSIWPFPPR
jgi:hypothetical protein